MNCRVSILAGLLLLSSASWPVPGQGPPANNDVDGRIRQAKKLQKQGRNEEARQIYGPLLHTLRERPPSLQLGYVLDQMSQIETAAGDYASAERTAQESADAYHQLSDFDGEAHAYNDKGIAEVQQGSYAPAQLEFGKALELARGAHSQETETQVLNNLGSAFYYQGQYQEALRSYEDAMRMVDQSAASAWSGYWRQITAFNEATLYQRLGRYNNALQIYQQLESSPKNLTAADRAHLYANLGALYRRLGDPLKALQSYHVAQGLYSTERDSDGEISVSKNVGIVYALDLGNLAKARTIFEHVKTLAQVTHNRREQMQAHLYLGETVLRQVFLRAAGEEFERARDLAQELGTKEEQWKALYGLGRVRESSGDIENAESEYRQAIAIIESTRRSLQLSGLRAEFLSDKRDAYDALIRLLVQKNDVPETFSYLERSRARTFQDRLTQAVPRTSTGSSLTLAEAQSHLPPETLLVEFWVFGDRIGVIWCRKDRYGMSSTELPSRDREGILALLKELPGGLRSDWRDRIAGMRALFPEDTSLYWAGIRHVLIVPDGWLTLVPFDLLPSPTNSKQLLIEEHDISYLPSAALLGRAKAPDRFLNFPWTQQLVAFGDPVFAPGVSGFEQSSTRRLPASADEVRSIARMSGGKTDLFVGRADLKKLFLKKANDALVLHVSTHALADGEDPEGSRMLFSPEGPDGAADYVFLRELYNLDLSNVRLATISACDTERGKLIRGEGVQGFSRALLSAGARSSLTTLWRVDDAATAEFMKQFYFFALEQHKPKAEALRLAKLKFLRSDSQLQNPQFWAAFVLNGDGLTPLPKVPSWAHLTVATAGLAAIVCLLFWFFLRNGRGFHGKDNTRRVVADHAQNLYRNS